MAPRNPALAGSGPFNPNWRLLGIAFCDKSFTGLQANPYKPWAPRAAARYPPSSPATAELRYGAATLRVSAARKCIFANIWWN